MSTPIDTGCPHCGSKTKHKSWCSDQQIINTYKEMKDIETQETVDLLLNMEENKLQALLNVTSIITDPLSQELIRKAIKDEVNNKLTQ